MRVPSTASFSHFPRHRIFLPTFCPVIPLKSVKKWRNYQCERLERKSRWPYCLGSHVPFCGSDLESVLRAHEVTCLVLLGIATSGVVLSTVRWAADADYALIVLEDCCADADEEVHRVLMQKVFPRQATVVPSQAFLQALAPEAEKP